MHHSPQPRLPLDNRKRHPHLLAQRRQEHHELDRLDIIRNEHQARLLVLHQPHNMIQPVLDRIRLLRHVLLLLAVSNGRRFFLEAFVFLGLGLGPVLVQELEGLRRRVAVEVVRELREGGGHLQAQVEDLALALQAHVGRPFDHAREVAARLDVLADAVVARAFFDERVLLGCWRVSG